jgi:hypothetical protein
VRVFTDGRHGFDERAGSEDLDDCAGGTYLALNIKPLLQTEQGKIAETDDTTFLPCAMVRRSDRNHCMVSLGGMRAIDANTMRR